ncbi:MAG: hypothetical protein CL484_06180 [Acidobacteria bacterium]|nr:hypothetical protein [Acidobacteriota bacterium]
MDTVLELLSDLVAIDSVNPSLVPGGGGEAAIGERVALALRTAGLDVDIREVVPGRKNIVGVLEARQPGRSLMLCGHLDTVGVEGMANPFDPMVRDGRLYGRGAQDMKSGLAAMVDAASQLAAKGGLDSGQLVVAAVIDEEHSSLGADALVRQYDADAAVITEPTDLKMATCHQGFEWIEVETRGRAAHGSRPADGRDAIVFMGRVLDSLDRLSKELTQRPKHRLLGTASLHASTIAGGRELSVYPDRCRLSMERRTLIGEPAKVGFNEVGDIMDRLGLEDAGFEGSVGQLFSRPPHEIGSDHPICRALGGVLNGRGLCVEPVGMSFWTDAAILAQAGIPSLLFGPCGSGLHSREEYVDIESVYLCRNVLTELAQSFC